MARRGVEFQLLGVGDLRVSLEGVRDEIRLRVEDALDDSAHAIQASARVNVPRDTGDLARAIQIAGKGLARFVGLADGRVASRRGRNSAHLNPWVYGLFVEFGLKHRNMAARPFMGPAVDREEPKHVQRVEAALNGAVGAV